MDAHITLPQIVKFLPNKIEGDLSINTINGYEVGVNAAVEAANISMALSFVVKSSPSGEPIPDKLYFSIGGFEPSFNVDGLGITWITGGLDNLYDTIYGKDGIPPLTLLQVLKRKDQVRQEALMQFTQFRLTQTGQKLFQTKK